MEWTTDTHNNMNESQYLCIMYVLCIYIMYMYYVYVLWM